MGHMHRAQRLFLALVVISGGLVACGDDPNLSLKTAMEGYKLHMEDVARAIDKADFKRAAMKTGRFREFMGSDRHQGWLEVMEADARTRYHNIAKRLVLLEEAATAADRAETLRVYNRLRGDCLSCHVINMKGTRREAIEATVPSLKD